MRVKVIIQFLCWSTTISSKLPVIRNRQTVASSRLFHIESMDMTFSNGVERQYERLVPKGHGAVLVIPMQDENTVLMIREYSAGTEDYQLVLPKGKIEADEPALVAANRELAEEIGFAANKLTPLGSFSISPGYMSHRTQIVLAEDLYPKIAEGDEPEPLEVVPCDMDNIFELTQREDCSEARTIAALYLAKDILSRRVK